MHALDLGALVREFHDRLYPALICYKQHKEVNIALKSSALIFFLGLLLTFSVHKMGDLPRPLLGLY